MPRILRKDAYYQRSPYWLGHDKGKNGQRRSENYVIFWYDKNEDASALLAQVQSTLGRRAKH